MKRGKGKIIGVIGGKQCTAEDYVHAVTVGRLIAEHGAVLVCGGRDGVMEAVCKGTREAGGIAVGILPGDDIREANPYVNVPIATGFGIGRNIVIIRTAQAVIAIDGSYGTLSEIAYALQLGKPVFALHSWNEIPGVQVVSSPEEAVHKALAAITRRSAE